MRDLALLSVLGSTIEPTTSETVVHYAEVQRGLLKYHVHWSGHFYVLCNAGDYQITEIPFDSFDEVLEYIGNGESYTEAQCQN